jgi:hypothetical protein
MDPFPWYLTSQRTRRLCLACHITRSDSLPQSDSNRLRYRRGFGAARAGSVQGFCLALRVCTYATGGQVSVVCCCDLNGRTPGADSEFWWDELHTLHKRLFTRDHCVSSSSRPFSSPMTMVNTQPQVCVFPLPFNGLEFGNSTICPISCHILLQNSAAMLAYGSPQPQVCLCVSTIIPKLHVMLVCFAGHCRGRRFPASGVCTYPVH